MNAVNKKYENPLKRVVLPSDVCSLENLEAESVETIFISPRFLFQSFQDY